MTRSSRSRHGRVLEFIAVSLPKLILGVLCFTGIAINFANVVGRYVFSAPIIWAEEILVYIMIWCVFIGAILVTWEGRHIKMDLIATHIRAPWRYIVNGFMALAFIAICLFVVKQSWTLTAMMAELDQQSVVAAMAPLVALGIVGANPALQDVAREADERLRRALAALEVAASKRRTEGKDTEC